MTTKRKSKDKVVAKKPVPSAVSGTPSSSQAAQPSRILQPTKLHNPSSHFLDDLLPTEPSMPELSTARVLLLGLALLSVATLGFYAIPGLVTVDNDDGIAKEASTTIHMPHLINAFYCAAITLTTIGYGDICPGNAGTLGKLFVMTLAGAGMGFFCGPLLQLGGAWRHAIPGGLPALASFVIGMGIVIFVSVEGLDHLDAVYASIVTGTTLGFGDVTPKTHLGKIAVALYAIVSVHAMGALLDPAREYLEGLCRRPKATISAQDKPSLKQD